jgi:AraC-like DNA-binding protein
MVVFTVIGIVLSVILLYFNGRKYPSSVYLSLFFFLTSLYCLNQYIIIYSKSVVLVSIFFLNFAFLTYLIGPMLYWYIRSLITDNPRFRKSDLLHLIPMAIFFVITLPYFFTSWSYKTDLATKIVNDVQNLPKTHPTALFKYFSSTVIYLSRPILVLGYTVWAAILFVLFKKKRKKELLVLSKQKFMTKWIFILLSCMAILSISHSAMILNTYERKNFYLFFTFNSLQIMSAIGMACLLISPFFFPNILYGFPQYPEPNAIVEPDIETLDDTLSETKRAIPNFGADYLIVLQQTIETVMEEKKPYLHPECNQAYLARLLNTPNHHLSYYFREVRKQTFNDFRNEWRVEHAKKLLTEGKSKEMTIEAIGLLSGFSSRNAFITAFKKKEGIPPGIFTSQFL